MALRIAIHELEKLIRDGLSRRTFRRRAEYLAKNVYLMTATQEQQLGYAIDSKWYGIPEFTAFPARRARSPDRGTTVERRHPEAPLGIQPLDRHRHEDAEGLRAKLLADGFSDIKYDSEKPKEILAEDQVIGAMKLGLKPESVRITPVEDVFAR